MVKTTSASIGNFPALPANRLCAPYLRRPLTPSVLGHAASWRGGDSREQVDQHGAFARRQGRQYLLLNVVDDVVEGPKQVAAGFGERDLVSPAVDWVQSAAGRAPIDEFAYDCMHVASIQIGRVSQRGLASRTEFVQRGKDPVVVSACSGAGERGGQQLVGMSSCLAQQPRG